MKAILSARSQSSKRISEIRQPNRAGLGLIMHGNDQRRCRACNSSRRRHKRAPAACSPRVERLRHCLHRNVYKSYVSDIARTIVLRYA